MKIEEFMKGVGSYILRDVYISSQRGYYWGTLFNTNDSFLYIRIEGLDLAIHSSFIDEVYLVYSAKEILEMKMHLYPANTPVKVILKSGEVFDSGKFKVLEFCQSVNVERSGCSVGIPLSEIYGIVLLEGKPLSEKGLSFDIEAALWARKTFGYLLNVDYEEYEARATALFGDLGPDCFRKTGFEYDKFWHGASTGRFKKDSKLESHNIPYSSWSTQANKDFPDFEEAYRSKILQKYRIPEADYSKETLDRIHEETGIPKIRLLPIGNGYPWFEKELKKVVESVNSWGICKDPHKKDLVEAVDQFLDEVEDYGYYGWFDWSEKGDAMRVFCNLGGDSCEISETTFQSEWFYFYDPVKYYSDLKNNQNDFFTEYFGSFSLDAKHFLMTGNLFVPSVLNKNKRCFSEDAFFYSKDLEQYYDTGMETFRRAADSLNKTVKDNSLILDSISAFGLRRYNSIFDPSVDVSKTRKYLGILDKTVKDNLTNFDKDQNNNEGDYDMQPIIKNELNEMTVQIPWPGATKDNVKVQTDLKERQIIVNLPQPFDFAGPEDQVFEKYVSVSDRYNLDKTAVSVSAGIVKITVQTDEGLIKDIPVSE